MKNLGNLKAAAIYMMVAFVGVMVSFSFVSCQKDEVTGHDNNGNNALAVKVKGDSVKPDPKPEDVYRNDTITEFRNDSVIVIIDYYKNDTIIDTKNYGALVSASISREFDKLQTTEARIRNLDFTFGEVSSSTNGKNQVIGRQAVQDGDGQNYNGQTTSGKIFDIYAELVSFKKTNLKNTELEPGKDEARLLNTNITWLPVVRIVNAPNLKGQTFELTSKTTEHLRYILKNAPEFTKYGDWKVWKETGNWNTVWHFECNEYWSNDSVAPKSKLATLKGSYSKIELSDKVVSNLVDYTHPVGTLVWGNWYGVDSRESGVTLFEKKGTKKSPATNGFDADKFNTEFTVTMQKADVLFCDSLFHVESDEASLTTKRNIFAEATSDMEGYSMVKFVDEEIAKWNGQYAVTLDEQCKLYMKIDTPEPEDPDLESIEFAGTKVHTNGMAKVDGSVIPVFTDGSKGAAIAFKWERAEQWYWKNDSVIAENVSFVMQETGTLKLKGSETKTTKTFATDNENITIKCNQYDADFQTTVKIDGEVKVTTWHATWYEDFRVVYEGKEVSLTKSSYSVKNANDKLTKDEVRTTATTEVWGYSVEGLFNIDEDSRSAYGYGRITKAIAEEVTEYWDKFDFEKDAKEYVDRVEYFLRWIQESSTGKKTTQDIKIILKRRVDGSTYTITVDDPQREIGSQSEETSLVARSESVGDVNVSYDWLTSTFELPNVFDGKTTKNDVATFVDPTNVKVTKKNSKGENVTIELPSFEHQLTSTVSDLQMVSETEDLVSYTYTRTWNWASTQCTSSAKSIGNINKIPEHGGGEPEFDLTVSKYFPAVCRPSNRDAADITAYTCLLVDETAMKCLAIGFYNGMITKGEVEDYIPGMNSGCFVKDQNKIVATTCTLKNGIIKYKDGKGNVVDAGTFLQWQGAGFNDRGNDWINHTGQYIPTATNQGGVCVVNFSGSSTSITVTGWKVQ